MGGGHAHVHVLKMWGMQPLPGEDVNEARSRCVHVRMVYPSWKLNRPNTWNAIDLIHLTHPLTCIRHPSTCRRAADPRDARPGDALLRHAPRYVDSDSDRRIHIHTSALDRSIPYINTNDQTNAPGHIAGHYTREQCHIDLTRLACFAGARLVHSEVGP